MTLKDNAWTLIRKLQNVSLSLSKITTRLILTAKKTTEPFHDVEMSASGDIETLNFSLSKAFTVHLELDY